ncbi:MAG: methionine adenosyltransferase [Alphaproteobacteria bacterium]|nr:methionine adenosyltransferase [Alphaproteobacteria bacterium]
MQPVILSRLLPADDAVEIVERKGIGHPDTICDALAETFSRNLCRAYLQRYGRILHHNVDKALLCGGRAAAAFGGGTVVAPIRIYLAGRATAEIGGDVMPIRDIAIDGSRDWLRHHMHALDPARHVVIEERVQPGSQDLRTLFSRRDEGQIALANDTSFGVGHAPATPLERLVLAVEQHINGPDRVRLNPAWGEDVKVMGVRHGDAVQLTIACAMIGRYLAGLDAYLESKSAIQRQAQAIALEHGFSTCEVGVNMADNPTAGSVYLTVTGTSAEAGDDGEVGRGNRVNGLITPCQPMSLEAAAGKNPASHVGKIYNVMAQRIAHAVVAGMPQVARAQCLMASRIGAPVNAPALRQVLIETRDGMPVERLRGGVEEIVDGQLARLAQLVDEFVAGTVRLY